VCLRPGNVWVGNRRESLPPSPRGDGQGGRFDCRPASYGIHTTDTACVKLNVFAVQNEDDASRYQPW